MKLLLFFFFLLLTVRRTSVLEWRRFLSRPEGSALSSFSSSVSPTPSSDCLQVFATYPNEDYDRRNEDVDPMAASAEYELEKRVERLDLFPVELEKGEQEKQQLRAGEALSWFLLLLVHLPPSHCISILAEDLRTRRGDRSPADCCKHSSFI